MQNVLLVSFDSAQTDLLVAGFRSRKCQVMTNNKFVSENSFALREGGGNPDDLLPGVFDSIDTVVYTMVREKAFSNLEVISLENYRASNLDNVIQIAEAAAFSDVKRFVYLSSTEVSRLDGDDGVSPQTEMTPDDYYAMSKREGEQALQTVSQITGMEVVIVRAAEVYGSGCDGWLAQVIKKLKTGAVLPYAGVTNQLSLLHVDNLVDALVACALHPLAAQQIWNVDDGKVVSTPQLLNEIGENIPQYAGLSKRSLWLLQFFAKLINQQKQVGKFLDSSAIDSCPIRKVLEWSPPVNFNDGIRSSVESLKNC